MPRLDPRPIYYVYVLFDWLGVPRYVGKGHGLRYLKHSYSSDRSNWLKNEFIERTWIMFEEIPAVIVQDKMSETEAFELEELLIKALGRLNMSTGPLVNMTDGGEGMAGQRQPTGQALLDRNHAVSEGHQRRTKEEKRAATELRNSRYPPGFWREKALERIAKMQPEDRSKHARPGGIAAGRLIWINDGNVSKRIDPASEVPDGWSRGRVFDPPIAFKLAASGTIWINNDRISRRITKSVDVPEGWLPGRASRST